MPAAANAGHILRPSETNDDSEEGKIITPPSELAREAEARAPAPVHDGASGNSVAGPSEIPTTLFYPILLKGAAAAAHAGRASEGRRAGRRERNK